MRLFPLVAGLLVAAPLGAQQPAATNQAQEAEVLVVIDRLWEAMRTRDSAMARTVFLPTARMLRVVQTGGAATVRWDEPGTFVQAIGRAKDPWIERMVKPEVRVDQNIASVWTWYDFTANGQLSHCGYDSIELARTAEGWKIAYLSDTRTPAPCQPPMDS